MEQNQNFLLAVLAEDSRITAAHKLAIATAILHLPEGGQREGALARLADLNAALRDITSLLVRIQVQAQLSCCVNLISGMMLQVRMPPGASDTACTTGDIVRLVVAFLAPRELGRASVVCRLWRDHAQQEDLWKAHLRRLLPAHQQCSGASSRLYLRTFYESIAQRRWWRRDKWEEGLQLSIEMWDGRDGASILSVCGPFRVLECDTISCTFLHVMGPDREEVVGPAFSAASKDPGSETGLSIYDYISRAGISSRVMVTDPQSGRMALLYQGHALSGTRMPLDGTFYHPDVIQALPPDRHHFLWDCCDGIIVSNSHGTFDWDVLVDLIMVAEPHQAGQPGPQRLYRAAGGDQAHYSEHDAFPRFGIGDSRENVGKCVMGLLWGTR